MQAHTYNIHEAKTHLSELLALAMQGEEVIIAKANKPLVRLTPLDPPAVRRVAGLHDGKSWTTDDFDDALPENFLVRS